MGPGITTLPCCIHIHDGHFANQSPSPGRADFNPENGLRLGQERSDAACIPNPPIKDTRQYMGGGGAAVADPLPSGRGNETPLPIHPLLTAT